MLRPPWSDDETVGATLSRSVGRRTDLKYTATET